MAGHRALDVGRLLRAPAGAKLDCSARQPLTGPGCAGNGRAVRFWQTSYITFASFGPRAVLLLGDYAYRYSWNGSERVALRGPPDQIRQNVASTALCPLRNTCFSNKRPNAATLPGLENAAPSVGCASNSNSGKSMKYLKAAAILIVCMVISLVVADKYPTYDDALALFGIAAGLSLAGFSFVRGSRKAS